MLFNILLLLGIKVLKKRGRPEGLPKKALYICVFRPFYQVPFKPV